MLVLAGCVAWSSVVRADDDPARATLVAPSSSPWTLSMTPYGWLPWLEGNATIKGRDFAVSANPAEVLEHTDMVWMSYMQAKNGPLTFFTDVIYADVGASKDILRSKTFPRGLSLSLGAALKTNYSFWTVEFGGMYEIGHWYSGFAATERPDTVLEVLAGGRYWRQDLDVTLALAGTIDLRGLRISGNAAIAESGAVQWVDPFIGARLRHRINPAEEIWVRADVGGFGAGSKFSWQAIAAYNWYLGEDHGIKFDGYAGYRALAVDYTQGDGIDRYVYDVVQHGPVLGVTGRF
jgi:hypothetical protein